MNIVRRWPMPLVIDLIDDNCLYVSAPIDEVDAARLKVGQSARVLLDAMPGRDSCRHRHPYRPLCEGAGEAGPHRGGGGGAHRSARRRTLLIGYSADLEVEVTRATEVLRVAASSRADDGSALRLEGERLVWVVTRWGRGELELD